MKDIIRDKSPVKEKNISSSLTKTADHLASNPILINRTKPSSKPLKAVAQSCPTFRTVPPPPPTSKPLIPSRDPPPMLLPPSPPVFSPMQVQAANQQLLEVKNCLSRSLTQFSSSCPDPSFLRPPFGFGNQSFDQKLDNDNGSMPQQILAENRVEEEDDVEGRMSELGKSPTIFSLLQGSSVPSSRATSLFAPQQTSSRANSVFNNRPSGFGEYGADMPPDGGDDLLFSISLDQHDNDTSYLADSTSFLHL